MDTFRLLPTTGLPKSPLLWNSKLEFVSAEKLFVIVVIERVEHRGDIVDHKHVYSYKLSGFTCCFVHNSMTEILQFQPIINFKKAQNFQLDPITLFPCRGGAQIGSIFHPHLFPVPVAFVKAPCSRFPFLPFSCVASFLDF